MQNSLNVSCVCMMCCFSIWQINTCWNKEYLFIFQIFLIKNNNRTIWNYIQIEKLYWSSHFIIPSIHTFIWIHIHLSIYMCLCSSTSWRIFYFKPNFLHLFLKNAIKVVRDTTFSIWLSASGLALHPLFRNFAESNSRKMQRILTRKS